MAPTSGGSSESPAHRAGTRFPGRSRFRWSALGWVLLGLGRTSSPATGSSEAVEAVEGDALASGSAAWASAEFGRLLSGLRFGLVCQLCGVGRSAACLVRGRGRRAESPKPAISSAIAASDVEP